MYMDLHIFFEVDRGWIQTFAKEGATRGNKTQIFRRFKRFSPKRGSAPPVECAPSPVLYNLVRLNFIKQILFSTGRGINETLFNDSVSPMVNA